MRRLMTTAALAAAIALPLAATADEETGARAGDDGKDVTVLERLQMDPQFSMLAHAIEQSGLSDALEGEGPLTIFAPTNAAFEELGDGALEPYMTDQAKLAELLKGHVVPGPVKATEPEVSTMVETLAGDTLAFELKGEDITIEDATVVEAGLGASNGVVHAIDQVLIEGQ